MTAVLLVEDDDAIRNNVARILRLEGYDVSVAANGIEGLERARAVRPDVVISDIKGALRTRLSTLKNHQFRPGDAPLRLKGFRLTRKIAAGGMTEVYLAVQEDGGLHDHAYIAMEYFERGDLRSELKAGMDRARVLQVVRQIARGLDVIHSHGVIHRDLKPENVMLRPDGSVAIADFGVAKSMLQEDNLALTQTRHGEVVGTPYYLSPEQASGGEIGPPSDVYSLGVMMYEMLTGQRPFSAETLDLLLARHLTAPVPTLPPQHACLQPVLEKMMAKQAEQRYPTARALLDALDAVESVQG